MSQIRTAFTRKNITELSWTGIGQIGSIILGILTIKIITKVGPEEYGLFVLAASVTGMLSMIHFGPMEQGFVRYYFDYVLDPRKRFVFLSFLIKELLLSIAGAIVLSAAAAVFLHEQFGVGYSFLTAAAFMVIFTASSVPVTGMLNAFRLRKEVAVTQLGEKILTLGLLGGLLFVGTITIPNVMACIALSAACWFLVRLKVYEKSAAMNTTRSWNVEDDKDRLVREITRRIATYSLPFVGWGLVSWIQMSGERWILGGFLSTSEVGRYGLGAALIHSSAVVAFNVLSQYVTPIIYEKYSHPNPEMRIRAFGIIRACGWITATLFLMAALFFYFAGEEIITIVSSAEFMIEPWLLLTLTVGIGLFYVGQMMTSAGLAAQRPQIYLVPKVITAALSLGAYTVGCMMAGVNGIVIAVFAINGLYAVLIAWTNHRQRALQVVHL